MGVHRRTKGPALAPSDDADLLVRARSDPTALAELYERHRLMVLRFAARRADGPQEVADLVSTIWLEVVASLDRFDPDRGEPAGWILGISANLCASERRRRRRERELLRRLGGRRELDQDDIARLEGEIDAATIAPRVRATLSMLSPSERAIGELVFIDGLTPTDAAMALSIRPAAARMRLSRARRRVQAALIEDGTISNAVEEASS